ncbi:hypothetical protein [Streptomyces sp. RPT161]|uniref:hypothetical protein n=1 Tax=Streptomyces sp. RPT161 TaxID=3015993 RepID=UPI0022B8B478|nr:hypothetical protein [Streptomyces sp. RPT161]
MGEWTDPKQAVVRGAYGEVREQHGHYRTFGRWQRRERWYDGFVMVAAPNGEVFTAAYGRSSEEPEQG